MPTDGPDAMVHGIPLNENVRVTIDVAIKGSSLLPIPVWDELITISQAIGSYVAWPREFIIFSSDELTAVDGDDALKMVYILMVVQFFGIDEGRTSIPAWLWLLVEDEKAFTSFLWGSYIFDVTLYWLKNAAEKHVKKLNGKDQKKEEKKETNKKKNLKKKKKKVVETEKKTDVEDGEEDAKEAYNSNPKPQEDYKNSLEKEVEFVNVTEIHDRASDREGDRETSMMEKADGENVVEKADSKSVVEKAKTIVATVVESVVEKVDGESVVEKADSKSVVEKAETVVATVVEKVNSESVVEKAETTIEKAEGVGDGEQPICLDDYLSTAVNMVGEVPTTLPSVIHVKFLDPNVEYKNHDKKMGK
ncbi:hypothetical protein LWI29_025685 [Acer saccharum]|uniref:DUF8039 domain-containing protein n=1 Tax=Acer saccharum TaxID=4024 RepID=A0AA39RLD1_ACESA|nr:hypothetical protein LWI29_025685 [Acer saccharum]